MTAPEAITQADVREAEDALDAYQADGFAMSFAMSPDERIGFKAGYRYAAHRRLTSHSAGEGLREALEPFAKWADWFDEMLVDDNHVAHGRGELHGKPNSYIRVGDLRRARTALLTPPSDAGSTTRSGGEGVCTCNGSGQWPLVEMGHAPGCPRGQSTTPSPDASPDSGERASVIGRLTNCIAAQRAIIDGPQYGTVETEAARLSYAAMLDARGLLAASPASLSGGAEEPWHTDLGGLLEAQRVMRQAYKAIETAKAQNTHIPGNPYEVALSSLNPALASLDALIVSLPSPEAPANRQEAAEVAIWSGEHRAYWRRGSRGEGANYTLDIDNAGIWTREEAAKLTSHCGPEKLIALHDRPTLTTLKDVKGEGDE